MHIYMDLVKNVIQMYIFHNLSQVYMLNIMGCSLICLQLHSYAIHSFGLGTGHEDAETKPQHDSLPSLSDPSRPPCECYLWVQTDVQQHHIFLFLHSVLLNQNKSSAYIFSSSQQQPNKDTLGKRDDGFGCFILIWEAACCSSNLPFAGEKPRLIFDS